MFHAWGELGGGKLCFVAYMGDSPESWRRERQECVSLRSGINVLIRGERKERVVPGT